MTPEQQATPVSFDGAFNYPAVLYLGFTTRYSVHHRGLVPPRRRG
jgi:hypothetical protein